MEVAVSWPVYQAMDIFGAIGRFFVYDRARADVGARDYWFC